MLNVSMKLSGDLAADLDKFAANIQDSVILSGAAAMARVIYDEVKLNTSGARAHGRPLDPPGVKTGTLNSAIYRVYAEDRSSEFMKVYRVSVNKRKAPHWHLLEYGWSQAPAHPYIRPAWDHVQQAIAAGKARMTQRLREGTAGLPT